MDPQFYGIKILKDGTWLYGGTPINRHNLVKLFASVLKRDAAGVYWLETPVERGMIEVEDAPFIAVEMTVLGQGYSQVLDFRTNMDDYVQAGADHPITVKIDPVTGEPAPYILVRNNLEARIARSVYYDLADLAVPEDNKLGNKSGTYGVWSQNCFYVIGNIKT